MKNNLWTCLDDVLLPKEGLGHLALAKLDEGEGPKGGGDVHVCDLACPKERNFIWKLNCIFVSDDMDRSMEIGFTFHRAYVAVP